jgi:dipeptidyl aminopeptidase/acylaminoacyl peptidase
VSGDRLQRLLERAGDDGRTAAELRAWPVAREAFAERATAEGSRRLGHPALALAALGAAAIVVALAVTSPGAAVADWVHDHILARPGARRSAPALTHLPGGGRILVRSPQGVWVVQSDGSRRLLRGYDGATWSPRGLYVGAWRGHELFAVEPGGRVHWSLARAGTIHAADWSPDGFRIAYLAGDSLRVVAGDGTTDTMLRSRVARVAPAWRPQAPHLLAAAPRRRTVDLIATDARAVVWRRQLPQDVRALSWSPDGKLLAVAGRTRIAILSGPSGRYGREVLVPANFAVTAIAFAHGSPRLAVALRGVGGRARVLTVDLSSRHASRRWLFAGSAVFSELGWSPDDRWLQLSWPAADQWLFLGATPGAGVRAVSDIARQFDPGAAQPRFPRTAGWCC